MRETLYSVRAGLYPVSDAILPYGLATIPGQDAQVNVIEVNLSDVDERTAACSTGLINDLDRRAIPDDTISITWTGRLKNWGKFRIFDIDDIKRSFGSVISHQTFQEMVQVDGFDGTAWWQYKGLGEFVRCNVSGRMYGKQAGYEQGQHRQMGYIQADVAQNSPGVSPLEHA
jgi:hypothetical protein